jgi:hypothetical protein
MEAMRQSWSDDRLDDGVLIASSAGLIATQL